MLRRQNFIVARWRSKRYIGVDSSGYVQLLSSSENRQIVATSAHNFGSERQAFDRTEVRPPAPSFFSSRMSLAASARSQSLNVTIFGSSVVAFGQMIQ
jgi:hypothetical protein